LFTGWLETVASDTVLARLVLLADKLAKRVGGDAAGNAGQAGQLEADHDELELAKCVSTAKKRVVTVAEGKRLLGVWCSKYVGHIMPVLCHSALRSPAKSVWLQYGATLLKSGVSRTGLAHISRTGFLPSLRAIDASRECVASSYDDNLKKLLEERICCAWVDNYAKMRNRSKLFSNGGVSPATLNVQATAMALTVSTICRSHIRVATDAHGKIIPGWSGEMYASMNAESETTRSGVEQLLESFWLKCVLNEEYTAPSQLDGWVYPPGSGSIATEKDSTLYPVGLRNFECGSTPGLIRTFSWVMEFLNVSAAAPKADTYYTIMKVDCNLFLRLHNHLMADVDSKELWPQQRQTIVVVPVLWHDYANHFDTVWTTYFDAVFAPLFTHLSDVRVKKDAKKKDYIPALYELMNAFESVKAEWKQALIESNGTSPILSMLCVLFFFLLPLVSDVREFNSQLPNLSPFRES